MALSVLYERLTSWSLPVRRGHAWRGASSDRGELQPGSANPLRSLKGTLIVWTTLGALTTLIAGGVVVYILVRTSLVEQCDRLLLDKAELLAAIVEQSNGELHLEFDEFEASHFGSPDHPAYLQVQQKDGTTVYRSPTLRKADLQVDDRASTTPIFAWVELPRGLVGRMVRLRFTPRFEDAERTVGEQGAGKTDRLNCGPVTLRLARDTREIDETLVHLRNSLLLVGSAAVPILAGVLWLVIRRSLRSLDQLACRISRLREWDLTQRVNLPECPHELQPVINRLNKLLGQLEAALQRERGFSADVAHELRTPLAGLRLKMDLALARDREPAAYRKLIADCQGIATEMQAMVDHLLLLASLESGRFALNREKVDLNDLLRDAWQPLADVARRRRLRVDWSLQLKTPVVTDPTQIAIAARNVIENAVTYADAGGTLSIETLTEDELAGVRIRNSGSRLSPDAARHVFDRFWRGSEARSEAGNRCGLGLSLTQRIVDVLGGTVAVETAAGGDFEITIMLPCS